MVELALTAERRNELAALLDDEERLRAEYPKVSDYLDMAPNLAGTGNVRVDAAFDLRFVHYVTGGSSVSANPYWDLVEPFVSEHEGRRMVNGGNPEGSARMAYAQMITGISSGEHGTSSTISWTEGANSGTEDALSLARRCRAAWENYLTANGLHSPF